MGAKPLGSPHLGNWPPWTPRRARPLRPAPTGDGYRPMPPSARAMAAVRKRRGLRIMVGGVIGTSLGGAPALLVAQQAEIVDLDGPLRLALDRAAGVRHDGSTIHPPDPKFWGGPS
jgi:hypothetical protein